MPALIAFLIAIGLWILAAFFFNNAACNTVDKLWWQPEFIKFIEKEFLLLCRI